MKTRLQRDGAFVTGLSLAAAALFRVVRRGAAGSRVGDGRCRGQRLHVGADRYVFGRRRQRRRRPRGACAPRGSVRDGLQRGRLQLATDHYLRAATDGGWHTGDRNGDPAARGDVQGVTITNPGSGLYAPPSVTFSPGLGITARGFAVLEAAAVASVTLTSGGSGYTSAPAVRFSGGGGNGATATARLALPPAPPEPPAGVEAVSDGGGSVTISWAHPGDPDVASYEYLLQRAGRTVGDWRTVPREQRRHHPRHGRPDDRRSPRRQRRRAAGRMDHPASRPRPERERRGHRQNDRDRGRNARAGRAGRVAGGAGRPALDVTRPNAPPTPAPPPPDTSLKHAAGSPASARD